MARAIGRTKSWLWWLGGLLCTLAFGGVGAAEEPEPEYGVRPRPRGKQPAASEADRKKAEGLVDQYLAPVEAAEPGAAAKKEIAALIKDFGSADFAKRRAASVAIVKHGTAALGALREAAKSSDAEVAMRARSVITSIEGAPKQKILAELRKILRRKGVYDLL